MREPRNNEQLEEFFQDLKTGINRLKTEGDLLSPEQRKEIETNIAHNQALCIEEASNIEINYLELAKYLYYESILDAISKLIISHPKIIRLAKKINFHEGITQTEILESLADTKNINKYIKWIMLYFEQSSVKQKFIDGFQYLMEHSDHSQSNALYFETISDMLEDIGENLAFTAMTIQQIIPVLQKRNNVDEMIALHVVVCKRMNKTEQGTSEHYRCLLGE